MTIAGPHLADDRLAPPALFKTATEDPVSSPAPTPKMKGTKQFQTSHGQAGEAAAAAAQDTTSEEHRVEQQRPHRFELIRVSIYSREAPAGRGSLSANPGDLLPRGSPSWEALVAIPACKGVERETYGEGQSLHVSYDYTSV